MNYKHAPAMVNRTFTRYYDFFVNAIFVGKQLQKRTLNLIELNDKDTFLDVGCGTGTLAILVKMRYKNANVAAADPDISVIEIARKKAINKKVFIEFIQSGAEALPLKDQSQSIVTSSLAFHHMPTEIKLAALNEIKRVLKKDGVFILVDIGKPRNILWKILCSIEAIVEPKEYIQDNLEGLIPNLIAQSGLEIVGTEKTYMGIHTWICRLGR